MDLDSSKKSSLGQPEFSESRQRISGHGNEFPKAHFGDIPVDDYRSRFLEFAGLTPVKGFQQLVKRYGLEMSAIIREFQAILDSTPEGFLGSTSNLMHWHLWRLVEQKKAFLDVVSCIIASEKASGELGKIDGSALDVDGIAHLYKLRGGEDMDESDELDKNIIYELRFTIEELRQIIIGCEQRKSWLVSGFNGKNEIANCQIKLFDSILERIEEAVRDQSF